jgi:hypothetical protein
MTSKRGERGGIVKDLWASILLLCTVSIAAAFGQSDAQDQPKHPFSITISALKPVVKVGDIVVLKVKLTNTSGQDINGSASYDRGLHAGYEYDVRDSSGTPVQRNPRSGPTGQPIPLNLDARIRTLKPNESVEEVTVISRTFDLSQPGEYVIQLCRRIHGNPGDDAVKSNAITITVTE